MTTWISAVDASNEAKEELSRLGLSHGENKFIVKGSTRHGTHIGGRGKSSGRGQGKRSGKKAAK